VAGRDDEDEDDEGIEMVAEPLESRDWGRLRPLGGMALWFRGCDDVMDVGETDEVEAAGRNEIMPRGLDALRPSPDFGFGGDGESSIMRTHPAESRLFFLSG